MKKCSQNVDAYFFIIEKCKDIELEEPQFTVGSSEYDEVYVDELDEFVDIREEDPSTIKATVGHFVLGIDANGKIIVVSQTSREIGRD